MLQKWICKECGFETEEKPEHKNSICPKCGKARLQGWNQCECGGWFHPERLDQKYCSKECGYKYRKTGGKKGKHYPHLQRARIAICPVCGKEFRAIHEHKGRKSVYCSKECWSNRAGKIKGKCKFCGKEFETYEKTKKYCSNECRNLAYRERKGEQSHFWQGGKTKESDLLRTSAEYKEWRLAVFTRDNFTCQKCGQRKRDIEAHHIKERCKYPELMFNVDNGLTLCHECHKETDNYGWKARWNNE